MSDRECREASQLRHELRARFAQAEYRGVGELLARLRALGPEVEAEAQRWQVRFELLRAIDEAAPLPPVEPEPVVLPTGAEDAA